MLTLEQIEASRQVNKKGTEANRLAKAHSEHLNAWNSKSYFLSFPSFFLPFRSPLTTYRWKIMESAKLISATQTHGKT
jgi:hypothetical protein